MRLDESGEVHEDWKKDTTSQEIRATHELIEEEV
jgi:hypothetical protein